MTKEEIRAGITHLVKLYGVDVRRGYQASANNPTFTAKDILTFLHENGVVIKVNPQNLTDRIHAKDSGYYHVEPLI